MRDATAGSSRRRLPRCSTRSPGVRGSGPRAGRTARSRRGRAPARHACVCGRLDRSSRGQRAAAQLYARPRACRAGERGGRARLTRAVGLTRADGRWQVATAGGATLSADRVVIATNGYGRAVAGLAPVGDRREQLHRRDATARAGTRSRHPRRRRGRIGCTAPAAVLPARCRGTPADGRPRRSRNRVRRATGAISSVRRRCCIRN